MAETAAQKRARVAAEAAPAAEVAPVAEQTTVGAAPEVESPAEEQVEVPAAEAAPAAEVVAAPAPQGAQAGAGSGTRVVTAGGGDLSSFDTVIDGTAETIVTIGEDVYEVHAAPGAPDRVVKKLLFHKGQQVPKSVLARHEAALKSNQTEVKRLQGVEGQRAAQIDAERAARASAAGVGETKEHGQVGETKEGSGVPRR